MIRIPVRHTTRFDSDDDDDWSGDLKKVTGFSGAVAMAAIVVALAITGTVIWAVVRLVIHFTS